MSEILKTTFFFFSRQWSETDLNVNRVKTEWSAVRDTNTASTVSNFISQPGSALLL